MPRQIVCGWDCELPPQQGIRLRCKRFTLLNFDDQARAVFVVTDATDVTDVTDVTNVTDDQAAPSSPRAYPRGCDVSYVGSFPHDCLHASAWLLAAYAWPSQLAWRAASSQPPFAAGIS